MLLQASQILNPEIYTQNNYCLKSFILRPAAAEPAGHTAVTCTLITHLHAGVQL